MAIGERPGVRCCSELPCSIFSTAVNVGTSAAIAVYCAGFKYDDWGEGESTMKSNELPINKLREWKEVFRRCSRPLPQFP